MEGGKMIDFFLKGRSTILRVLILLAAFIVFPGERDRLVSAQRPREDPREILLLRQDLKKTIQEEFELRSKIRDETQLAVRPYADYLLYQKSVHLFDDSVRLDQLKKKRMNIVQRLALLQREPGKSLDTLGNANEEVVPLRLPTYSGAPLFSFYDPNRFDQSDLPNYHPFWTNLLRLMISLTVLSVFLLPLIAVWRTLKGWPDEEMVRIYPILTVSREDGRMEVLQMRIARK
jgi:hypothetical protein